MKKIILLTTFIILLCGCGNSKVKLEDVLAKNNYIIVDVRSLEEYNESHLVGAINIPHDTIDETVNLDKTKDILVYCRSGSRSNMAKVTLEKLGYIVYDLGAFDSIDLPKE